MIKQAIKLIEKGLVPDLLIRQGIRKLCAQRLRDIKRNDPEKLLDQSTHFIEHCNHLPFLAEATRQANEQHYEIPTEFFKLVLGKHLKNF